MNNEEPLRYNSLEPRNLLNLFSNIQTIDAELQQVINNIDNMKWTENELSLADQQRAWDFLKKNVSVFAWNSKKSDINSWMKHHIDIGDAISINVHNRPQSMHEQKITWWEIDEMFKNKIVKPFMSSWSVLVVLITKKDDTTSFWVNYHRLNKVTKKDVYSLLRIDKTLNKLGGMVYYSSIDLVSGY